jgi:hypothetical protein
MNANSDEEKSAPLSETAPEPLSQLSTPEPLGSALNPCCAHI